MTTNKGDIPGTTVIGVKLYSVSEVSKMLDVTTHTIRSYIKQKRLKARKIGVRYMITEKDLYNFITKPDN